MPKRIRVVTAQGTPAMPIVAQTQNPQVPRLTQNEIKARKFITTTTMGFNSLRTANSLFGSYGNRTADTIDSQTAQFYSPQLSTDFLEKPQNLRERRAFYRFFYTTNEVVRRAIDIHSTLPLSKLRLVPPKGKNKHQNEYVYKFFLEMCDKMKLFKSLIEIAFEYNLMGNCVAFNAEIKASKGSKLAQNVELGDFLLTDKGRYKKVINKCSRLVENILKIKCWKDYRELPVTEEHPIEIVRDNSFIFEKAENLSVNDYIRITWPIEIEDKTEINLSFSEDYKKVENGYEGIVKISHQRSDIVIKARKGLISWLGSLKEPTIKTRQELAAELDVPLTVLHSTVYILQNELNLKFHKRLPISKGMSQRGSQVQWLPIDTSNIETIDYYLITRHNLLKAIDTLKIDNDLAYLAGFWMGDGTLSRDSQRDSWGRGLWQISQKESETKNIDRIKQILINIFGQDSITEWTSEGMKYIKVISNPAFIEWWAENFGETSFGKNYKRIPLWFIKLPIEKLQHFISGLVDSDGCISYTGSKKDCIVNISMASKAIMDSVRDIALKCGIVPSYSRTKERDSRLPNGKLHECKKMYGLTASDETSCRIMTEYATKEIPEEAYFSDQECGFIRIGNDIAFKVKSIISEPYNDLVYNFEVAEDHTYQVAGFSTHNCFIFTEENNWRDDCSDAREAAKKLQESKQRSEYLKQQYQIVDNDPLFKGWDKIVVLPPDQVRVRKLPLSSEVAVEYMPDPETRKYLTSDIPIDPMDPTRKIKNFVSKEMQEKIRSSGVIPLDSDPNTGSHVFHLARKKSQYEPLGTSMIESCVNTLVLMDKLRQAQTSIASRHMTPMRVVWADQLNNADIDNLREQVDQALVDPDFSIVANYEIHWEEMGSQGRLLDIEAENESNLNRLFAGLGVTREILTGEGTYTGNRISLEIMNTEYLLFREILQDYVENYLFKPIARKKGFVELDDYGNEVLLYPKLSFTRLAIRDNEHYFDSVFQLYQKGSISIDLLLDVLNIDPESTRHKIEQDIFTVNDSIFNEVLRNIYTSAAAPLVEKTNVVQRLAEYLKLEMAPEPPPSEGGESRFSSDKKASEQEQPQLSQEQKIKLGKVMKYFTVNPNTLDKLLSKAPQ